jgi:DNA-binding XRE family transcriptional regulator
MQNKYETRRYKMDLGKKIAYYRKHKEITQDTLAKLLGISNQAVSKWETNQSCPDIELLPMIADVFGITLDELFDRESSINAKIPTPEIEVLPWEDDETLRAVLFVGHRLVQGEKLREDLNSICKEITFNYDGAARNVESYFNVCCENVEGSVAAGAYVECSDVGGFLLKS